MTENGESLTSTEVSIIRKKILDAKLQDEKLATGMK